MTLGRRQASHHQSLSSCDDDRNASAVHRERLHPSGQHSSVAYLSIMPKSDRDKLLFWKIIRKNNKTGIYTEL